MPGMTQPTTMSLHPITVNKPYDVLFSTGSTVQGTFIFFMDDDHLAFVTNDRVKPTVLATYQYINQHNLSLLNGHHDNKHLAINTVTLIQKAEAPKPARPPKPRTEPNADAAD